MRHASPTPGWGQTQAPVSLSFDSRPPPSQITVERDSPAPRWIKRAILVIVLVAIGVGAWIERERISDAATDATDWVTDRFSDDDPTDASEASAGEGDEAFLRWEDMNSSELDRLSDEIVANIEPFLTPAAANAMGPAEYREIVTSLRAQLEELVGMVDGAPHSPLRSAALEIFLKQLAGVDELLVVIDTGSQASLQRGQDLLNESMADYHRHAATYSGRSTFFRQ